MAKKSKKLQDEPQWKTVERVVALLEKSLCPEARVRHNVTLPHIVTGHDMQCDVVIETGQSPRITRTIVEVQKRNQRVKPNDFRGWCQKMRDVGAQRLICVSAQPFPRSIKDEVAKVHGPTVWLIKLNDLETKQWPIEIAEGTMSVFTQHVELDPAAEPVVIFAGNPFGEPKKAFKFNENSFRRGGSPDWFSLKDFATQAGERLNNIPQLDRLPEGVHHFIVTDTPSEVSFQFEGVVAVVKEIRIPLRATVKRVIFPFQFLSYHQEGTDKALAWIALATGTLEGEQVSIRFVLVPTGAGSFALRGAQISGTKEKAYLLWGYVEETN